MTLETEKLVLETLSALAREAPSPYIRVDLARKLEGLAHGDPAIERVYKRPLDQIEVPTGYVLTGEFRPPREGEWFICDELYVMKAAGNWSNPRLILREGLPVPKAPDGYELTGEYRVPRKGEYWYNPPGCPVLCLGNDYAKTDVFWILRKKPIELLKRPTAESIYGKPAAELKVPEGWELTGEFRPIRQGDDYLGAHSGGWFHESNPDVAKNAWRFLLRRKLSTIESVYGKPLAELKPPKGFRFTGEFRVPREAVNEWILSNVSGTAHRVTTWGPVEPRERLILRPAKRLVFDIVDEGRYPVGAEWFQEMGSGSVQSPNHMQIDAGYRILSEPRVEEA